jgi:DNA polymerase-1
MGAVAVSQLPLARETEPVQVPRRDHVVRDQSVLFLIDGSSYLYRAYFAIRQSLSTHEGLPTKAIYGVTNMLWKVLREKDPEFIAVVWDAKGRTFRHELYADYKANRPAMPEDLSVQIPHVRKVVETLGIPQLEMEGYEADDIIATLARGIIDRRVLIVSGDKDLLQLIDSHATVWDPMKDEVIDLEAVRTRFELEPAQLLDVMALSGDTSDNIPGVSGVGPKTAQKLIRTYGSIESLYARFDELPKGKLRETLKAERERIPLWLKLVRLADDMPVSLNPNDYRRRPPDDRRLRELFQELEFTRFLKDLVPEKAISFKGYELVQSRDRLGHWMERIRRASRVTIDTETTSEFPMRARLVGISLCVDPPEAAYVPISHVTVEPQLSLFAVVDALGPLLADPVIEKVGQNIKYDMIVLKNHGMELGGIGGDTMVASYLLNPSKRRHNLADIAQEFLGHKMISFKEVTSDQKHVKNFAHVSLPLARDYSCEDVHVTSLAKEILWEKLRSAGLWGLFEEVEVPLIPVIAGMESAGILVDRQGLDGLSEEFSGRLSALEREIFDLAGGPFKINSPRQLAEILFVKLKLPQSKKTKKKTGFSTDVEVLTQLAAHHDLPRKILEYRNLGKLSSTYVEGLRKMADPETGRVHTSFNQTVTATGRLSSSDPNLQNIPVRTEEGRRIRAVFVAEPGNCLLSADYSQIDLRVLAHYSGDRALVEAFRNGEDIHRRTAAEVYDVAPELVSTEMRRGAKTVNFGIIYGMSAFGLAKELGMERRQAQEFIDRYFARYPGVKKYMDDVVRRARETGYVTTVLGRRRYIPDLRSRVRTVREFAERTAINTPIQGTAADIIKLAMIDLDRRLQRADTSARMLLQVHDELVIEVPEKEVEGVSSLVKNAMEGVMELVVPLEVTVGWGPNWAELSGKSP